MQHTSQSPLFTGEETKTQGDDVVFPGSHSLLVAEMDGQQVHLTRHCLSLDLERSKALEGSSS